MVAFTSPALTERLGVVFTGAARFELAFWEMCWSGQAWPG
jgi:thiaminase